MQKEKLDPTSKQHHKKSSQPNLTRNLTITSSRECVCLEANWPLVRANSVPLSFHPWEAEPNQGSTANVLKTTKKHWHKQEKLMAQPKQKCFPTKKKKSGQEQVRHKFRFIRIRIEQKNTQTICKQNKNLSKWKK